MGISAASKTRTMVLIAMMAAVTCILGPLSLSIPVSPVPISLTNLAVYFTVYVLGMKLGTVSYLIYMLLGLVGLPVFPDSPKTRQSCSDLSAVTLLVSFSWWLSADILSSSGAESCTCILSAWCWERRSAICSEQYGLLIRQIWAFMPRLEPASSHLSRETWQRLSLPSLQGQ